MYVDLKFSPKPLRNYMQIRVYFHWLSCFATLLETRVEYDADMIEEVTDQITGLSKTLNTDDDLDQDILIQIKSFRKR